MLVAGSELHVVRVGRGEPIVFVHGSLSDHRTWAAQLDAFADRFQVIAYSRRGHWPNDPLPPERAYTMDEQLADLAALVRALDAGPVHLVGNSYGAFLCLLLAIREPSMVASLALGEPPVLTLFMSMPPRPPQILSMMLAHPRTGAALIRFGAGTVEPVKALLGRGETDAAMDRFLRAVLGSEALDRLPGDRLRQARDNVPAFTGELLGPGFLPLSSSEVRGVQAPVLLLTGARTPSFLRRLSARLEQLLPRAEHVALPDASHLMHEQNPRAFNDAITAFLSRHARSAMG